MPEPTGFPSVKYKGEGNGPTIQMTETQKRAVEQVEQLFNQGWTETEIERVLTQRGVFDAENMSSPSIDDRVTTAFIPFSPAAGVANVGLFSKIRGHTRCLDSLMFHKKRHAGIGFKVTCDAAGKNAIVSRIQDPTLLQKGLCIGSIVTHIEDMEVTDMDHFDILEKYRECTGHFSIVFAVPGSKPHSVPHESVRKSGHKFTSFIIILSCLLSIAALSYNEVHTGTLNGFPIAGKETDIVFRWNEIDVKHEGSIETYQYRELRDDSVHGKEWDQVQKPGSLFFGCTIASIVLYIFLLLLSIILATRRPRILIQENGEMIRSVFIILNMIVCLTTLSTWAAWISEFKFPGFIMIDDNWVNVDDYSLKERISTSIILEIFASFCMLTSIFTAVVQK